MTRLTSFRQYPMRDKKLIAIVQPVVPDYREPLFETLAAAYPGRLRVYAGAQVGRGTICTVRDRPDWLVLLRNHALLGERFLWQQGGEQELREADVVILSSSLRTTSSLWLLARRRCHQARTLLWGHVQGRYAAASTPRQLQFRLSDGFIAYTDHDAGIARRMVPAGRVWTAPNSCVWKRDCIADFSAEKEPQNIICVGRLVAAKKPMLLLEAFAMLATTGRIPSVTKLIFVGAGPLGESLQQRVETLGLKERVIFHGHVWQPADLWPIYDQALVAVSPGYVGLAAVQSFARGVMLVVSRHEPHAPELDACQERFNTLFFRTNDVTALAGALAACFAVAPEVRQRRPAIARNVASRYTYDAMVAGFCAAIEGCR